MKYEDIKNATTEELSSLLLCIAGPVNNEQVDHDLMRVAGERIKELRIQVRCLQDENLSLRGGVQGDLLRLFKEEQKVSSGFSDNITEMARLIRDEQDRAEQAETERDRLIRGSVYAAYSAFMEGCADKVAEMEKMDNQTASAIMQHKRQIEVYARNVAERCVNEQLRRELEK